MYNTSHTTEPAEVSAGFTLIELLVVMLVGASLIAAFTTFYVAQQRAVRRNEVDIETSQALRVVIEQMSRDLRIIGRDLTRAGFVRFNTATATNVDFNLDMNDDGVPERKQFRYNSNAIQKCDGNAVNCAVLADFAGATSLTFAYADCGGNNIPAPVTTTANLARIGRVDIQLTLTQGIVGGTQITRTESDSITMRNLCN